MTALIVKIGASVVVFALCFAMFIYSKSALKHIDSEDLTAVKKKKKTKKLSFVGMIISLWFLLGVFVTEFSGKKMGLHIEFSMFSERVNFFGISLGETTVISLVVCAIITVLFVIFRLFVFPRFKEEPRGFQNAVEICVETVDSFVKHAVGEKSAKFMSPYMFTIAVYLIGCASVELLGYRAPTSDLTCTLAIGIMTFILLNLYGVKTLGIVGRIKSMGGPVAPMRVIMVPLKMVSDIAVPISLACRLFGNMLGGMIVMELIKGALGGFASGITGVAGLYFNLFHPLIQAYIFVTLSLTFIEEAMQPVDESGKKDKKVKS